jgi:hypothetical protein
MRALPITPISPVEKKTAADASRDGWLYGDGQHDLGQEFIASKREWCFSFTGKKLFDCDGSGRAQVLQLCPRADGDQGRCEVPLVDAEAALPAFNSVTDCSPKLEARTETSPHET